MRALYSKCTTGKCHGTCGCQRPGINKELAKLQSKKVDSIIDSSFKGADYDEQPFSGCETVTLKLGASPVLFKELYFTADQVDVLKNKTVGMLEVLPVAVQRVDDTNGNNPFFSNQKSGTLHLADGTGKVRWIFSLYSLMPNLNSYKRKLIRSNIDLSKSFVFLTSTYSNTQILFNFFWL